MSLKTNKKHWMWYNRPGPKIVISSAYWFVKIYILQIFLYENILIILISVKYGENLYLYNIVPYFDFHTYFRLGW